MRKSDHRRWLPVFAVAVLACLSSAAFPEEPATAVPDSPQILPKVATVKSTPEEIGDALMTHQRYQAAIEAYKKAPSDSASQMNKMGIAYQMMFSFDDALRCYKESLKIEPDNPHVYNNLGTLYDSLGQYRSAEHMYRKALKLNPGSALALKNLGTDLLFQQKYDEGWKSYKAALAIDPKIFEESANMLHASRQASASESGAMNYYMAKGCLRAGMTDRAIEYLRKSLNEGFTNPKKIAADSEFTSLRGVPAFVQLLASQAGQ